MSHTIALVDDDRNILTSISMALENEGFKVQTYIDAENALVGISRNPPDLAVIDIKMPRMDGEELLKRLRKKTTIPILFLTSKDEEVDELLGLKLDPSQLECEWNGKQLPDKLTTTEFLIVKELAKRPGIIKERAQLMDIAYREDTDIEDRTIDSHVKRIRKKFKKVDPDFSAIETRYGSGYRWNVS